jgi:hypothetical protein
MNIYIFVIFIQNFPVLEVDTMPLNKLRNIRSAQYFFQILRFVFTFYFVDLVLILGEFHCSI